MKTYNLGDRQPIWIALSEFYLDTELDDSDYQKIAQVILKSPFKLEDVKIINKYEIFPVLRNNLGSVAGSWSGFDETSLVNAIISKIDSQTKIDKLGIEISYFLNSWMTSKNWRKLEKTYNLLSSKPIVE